MLSRGCWTAQVQNISIITETSSGQHSCRRQKTSLSNVSLLKQWTRFPKSSCLLTALPEDQKKTSLAFFFSCILLPSLTSLKKLQTMYHWGRKGADRGLEGNGDQGQVKVKMSLIKCVLSKHLTSTTILHPHQ